MRQPESTLFLAGGGSAEQSAPIDAAFVERIRQSRADLAARVASVPVALAQHQDQHSYEACRAWFEQTFSDMIPEIDVWTDLAGVSLDDLRRAGAVYVGGGDADVLLHQFRATGFEA